MRLIRLSIKNIRSYKKEDFFFPDGSLLLAGDVGSGKTTLLLAIEYALFGLQPGQKATSLLRNNCSTGEVILEFEVDGKEILIERKIKRDSKSISTDYSAITINGKKLEYSVTELKNSILKILGYPSEFIKKNNILYRYTVYTPQEQMKQIILEDTETRINILRHIFGMDKYKKVRENCTTFISFLREESKLIQGQVKSLEDQKSKLASEILNLNKLNSSIQDKESLLKEKILQRKKIESEARELEDKIKERENFEKEIEKTKILIASKRENLATLKKEEESLKSKISEEKDFSESDFVSVSFLIEEKRKKIDQLNSDLISTEARLASFNTLITENFAKRERISKIQICPTCLQDVSENHKHNIKNETERIIFEIKNTIESLEKEKINIVLNLNQEKKFLIDLENQLKVLEIKKSQQNYILESKRRLDDLLKSKDSLEKDISFLSTHLISLKEYSLSFAKFNSLYKSKKEELSAAFSEERKADISLAETKKEISIKTQIINSMTEEINRLESLKAKHAEIIELIDWLTNSFMGLTEYIERSVMVKLREEFSRLLSKWFAILVSDTFEIQLDEKFTPIILQGDVEMDYSFLSGGERTAVALAYRLALNQTLNSLHSKISTRDLIILDEPTEGFSEAQIEKIRDILAEINANQLIIVSHEQKVESFVDNIIKIKKEGDVSIIESVSTSNIKLDQQDQKT